MKVLFVGHKIKINWPLTIIIIWLTVIIYSSLSQNQPLGVSLVWCPDPLSWDVNIPSPILTKTTGD